ncbi:PucR family transcriptional regulator [Lentzea sp. NPDC059081]|uniref:PucR family transcriptional regulator n=1 Tax=Lentzea sp. NPDC059081 TaxID=3346719 RepID=UPI0036757A47
MSGDFHESAWEPVRRVCLALADESTEIADTVTWSIRTTQPVYTVVPEDEHRAAVVVQLRNKLRALAERRALSPSELAAATDLAARRAVDGIPIDAVIAAYQAADTVIWKMVVERSTPEAVPLLPHIGTLLFETIRETTTAMAGAHSRVARAIDGGRITLAHQFLERLEDLEQRSAAADIATRLQFDPEGDFAGLVWLPEHDVVHPAMALLPPDSTADVVSRVVAGGRLEIVVPAQQLPALTGRGLAEGHLQGRWGIGLVRRGIAGAGESLRDARMALAATSASHPVRTFEQDWHEAVLLAERPRYGGIVATAVETARAHPHLAETVLAFAAANMSIAATVPAVHVHANTVTYRLDRWSQLTGLDARSFAGLTHSVTACLLSEMDR